MKVTALGVGDAFSARWYSTCLLIEQDDARLLIDCPHPIRKVLADSGCGVDLLDLDGVIVTHLHADHCSGLEGLGFFNLFVRHEPLPLLIHPGVGNRLWEGLAPGMDTLRRDLDAAPTRHHLEDYFAPVALSTEHAVTFGPFSIACRWTQHHVPTTALRITAAGRTLGYSADTAFDPTLLAWLDRADVIIHETNLGTHTPIEALLELPPALRNRLRLVHYPDWFDVEGCAIRCLAQGESFDV